MSESDVIVNGPAVAVIARRGSYYRNTRIIVTGMVIAMGCWFLYDGFVGYPDYNDKFDSSTPSQQHTMTMKHSDSDIKLQRGLGVGLLPLGIILAVWFWYASRGAYRLEGDTLHVPGHPPVPLTAIREVDKTRWDRKGIACIDYELANGTAGTFWLDDFVYDRKPTDAILARIETVWKPLEGIEEGTAENEGETNS